MNIDIIRLSLRLLEDSDIRACLIGELALNYYNVPRVIHDLEICVDGSELSRADAVFKSCSDFLEPFIQEEYNLYNEYQRGFPRFRFRSEPSLHVVLFSSEWVHLDPLKSTIIRLQEHQQDAVYSHEITDVVYPSAISSLPLPRLAPLFKGMCRKFLDAGDVSSRIAAEQLVDGMDLDIAWCKQHMSSGEQAYNFALELVEGKASRIDPFFPNEEAQRLVKTPGRNEGIVRSDD